MERENKKGKMKMEKKKEEEWRSDKKRRKGEAGEGKD